MEFIAHGGIPGRVVGHGGLWQDDVQPSDRPFDLVVRGHRLCLTRAMAPPAKTIIENATTPNGDMTMRLEMDRDLPQGLGVVLDANYIEIARIQVPGGKRPPGAHILVVSIEDFAAILRMLNDRQQ